MENQESIYEEKQGNLLTGILGAFLGALIGTALWVLVGVWGYIASIVAWLTAFLAGKGYDLLHGRPGKAKTITIIVMLILSICVGTVGTVAVVGVQSIKEAEEEMNSFELAHLKKLYLTLTLAFYGMCNSLEGVKVFHLSTCTKLLCANLSD